MMRDIAEPLLVRDGDIQTLWGADLHAFGCLTCGVVHLVPPDQEMHRCPACLADALEPQPVRLRPEPPELAVPFSTALTRDLLSSVLSAWLRGMWLRPVDLRGERLLSRLTRVYLPMWLVDGEVAATWAARMGFDYQVESSQERFNQGRGWTSQRQTETQVRWGPRAGRLTRTYHNLAVSALEEREEAALTARVGRYDWSQAVAYVPATIADTVVRAPSLLPDEAWPMARAVFDQSAAADCQQAAGAQHNDEFALDADYRNLNWTQLLLPLYTTYYADDKGRLIPVWINGQSGRVGGLRRASLRRGWRVTGALALIAIVSFAVGALLALLGLDALASILMSSGFFLAVLSILPVLWVWQFNQQQRF